MACVADTDASDWDSASTASKRTLPGHRLASPVHELPECSHPCVKEQEENDTPTAPLTPQRSNNSSKSLASASPQPAPHPQPRARKMVLLKPESEEGQAYTAVTKKENLIIIIIIDIIFCLSIYLSIFLPESDWEAENSKSSSKMDAGLQNIPHPKAVSRLGKVKISVKISVIYKYCLHSS